MSSKSPDAISVANISGVKVELSIARAGARAFAFIIDYCIRSIVVLTFVWVVLMLVSYDLAFNLESLESMIKGDTVFFFVFLPAMMFFFLYHPVLEFLMNGRTPGKLVAGIRIVHLDGSLPTIGPILIRNVFRLLDSLPGLYLVGLVAVYYTRNSVRVGDLAANTVLVYEDQHLSKNMTATNTATADKQSITFEQIKAIKSLLHQWYETAELERQESARKILTQLEVEIPVAPTETWFRAALNNILPRAGSSSPTLEQAEIVQDLLNRWSQIAPAKRDQVAQELLLRLGKNVSPSATSERLRKELTELT